MIAATIDLVSCRALSIVGGFLLAVLFLDLVRDIWKGRI